MACEIDLERIQCQISEALIHVTEDTANLELDTTIRSPNGHMLSRNNKGRGKAMREFFQGVQYMRRIQYGPVWLKTRTVP